MITQRNAEGVSRTRGGTADLLEQARALTGLMSTPKGRRRTDATAETAVDLVDAHHPHARGGDDRSPLRGSRLE